MNEKTLKQQRNANNIAAGIPPFMIQSKYELLLEENHNDLMPKYDGFDVITRRYLDYCQHSGASIEDYVVDIKDSDLSSPVRTSHERGSLSPDRRLTMRQATTIGEQSHDHLGSTDEFDELVRNGSISHNNEARHKNFLEYLKKMGMREYDNGTKIFYEDEYDNHQNTSMNTSSINGENIEYDIDLINQLFERDPAKQIRISYEYKEQNLNQDGALNDKAKGR